MILNKRKIVLVGTGMVGMSFAYSALNQAVCDELVLVAIDSHRPDGDATHPNNGGALSPSSTKLYTAYQSIIGPITHSGFSGIFLVATNPVDIMTRVTYELSGFNSNRVFGTGTTLDTARLRYLLGDYFTVDPRNVHAYVIGEHGDSEFVPWSQAMVATKSVADICEQSQGKFCLEEMQTISVEVRDAAQKIIEAKRATYYGIGMALVRIVRAVLSNENSVLTVSARLRGEYGQRDVFAGVPCTVNRNGAARVLELSLTEEERQKLADSCAILQESYQGLEL